jgi:hypothetical protein
MFLKNTTTGSTGDFSVHQGEGWIELTESEILACELQKAKDKKKLEIKTLRDSNLLKSTPQTIVYSGNLENRTFNIGKNDINTFSVIISSLQKKINNLLPHNDLTAYDGGAIVIDSNSYGVYQSLVDYNTFPLNDATTWTYLYSITRSWSDSTGERIQLTIDDFESLLTHIERRDEQEYDQARLKIQLLNSLETLEEVEDFDITQIII